MIPLAGCGKSGYREGKSQYSCAPSREMSMPDESTPPTERKPNKLVSRTALALGAAGLFLFIVGVKRRHRLDPEREIDLGGPRKDAGK